MNVYNLPMVERQREQKKQGTRCKKQGNKGICQNNRQNLLIIYRIHWN
jgi:hypothetical protein